MRARVAGYGSRAPRLKTRDVKARSSGVGGIRAGMLGGHGELALITYRLAVKVVLQDPVRARCERQRGPARLVARVEPEHEVRRRRLALPGLHRSGFGP